MTFWQSRYNSQLKLSQQDLLDISEEITQAYTPNNHYIESELVLMPVDPTTLYAYWKVNKPHNKSDSQLILRVYSEPKIGKYSHRLQLSFDIKITPFQGQQKIPVPLASTAYSAVIGEINIDHSFKVLVSSEIIQVPRETPVVMSSLNEHTKLAIPKIDSINMDVNAPIKADNSPVLEQKISPENNIKQPKQQLSMFDNLFVTESNHTPGIIHSQRKTPELELNNNTAKNQYTATNNATAEQAEPFILNNFNNQGYDLKVYVNSNDSEFVHILSMQKFGFYISPTKLNTSKRNSSGLGLYL